MSITNKWLTPYQRSFQQIKDKLLEKLKDIKNSQGKPLITDYSEGNIFILIISMLASIAEILHYYIDNMARESLFTTARRYDSLVKHGNLIDYHPHGATSSTVDVVISRPFDSENLKAKVLISRGMVFTDNSGNEWQVIKDTTWDSNTTEVTVSCIQHSFYDDTRIQGYQIPSWEPSDIATIDVPSLGNGRYYEHNSMHLKLGDDTWALVDTFAFSKSTDKHFMVEVNRDGSISIRFGDGQFGSRPSPGTLVTECNYYITKGANGNIPSGAITSLPPSLTSTMNDATCSNPYPAGGGNDYESFTMLKEHIPLHLRTQGVAITKQDFVDLAMQVPGVNKASAEYECGRKLAIYITPDNGEVASTALCDKVYQVLSQKAPLTTWLNVVSAGVTKIILDIDITGNKSFSASVIQNQVEQALLDKYSIEKAQVGGSVRISDIYALIDNLSSVDYLNLNTFYIKPWPNILYGNTNLIINQFSIDYAKGSMLYYITFVDSRRYQLRAKSGGLYINGTIGTAIKVLDQANNIKFNIDFTPNNYQVNYRYTIVISEPNKDYVEPGYNLPLFTDPTTQLTLNIKEVL